MVRKTQFDSIKWIKPGLQSLLKQANTQLAEIGEPGETRKSLEKCAIIFKTISNNLEVANDEIGSLLCTEIARVSEYVTEKKHAKKLSAVKEKAVQGIVIVGEHLDNLTSGLAVNVKNIGEYIDSLRALQSKPPVDKSLLFSPDLSNLEGFFRRDISNKKLEEFASKKRGSFQRNLLAWFKNTGREDALLELVYITKTLNELATVGNLKLYFKASSAIIDAIYQNIFTDESEIKRLVGRIDRQMKLIAAFGEAAAAKALPLDVIRQTLYFTARLPSDDSYITELQKTYQLKSLLLMPEDSGKSVHSIEALSSIATTVREEFRTIRAWLENIVETEKPTTDEIDKFIKQAEIWTETLSFVGEKELSKDISDFVRQLAFCIYGAVAPNDEQLVDIAEGWIKIDKSLIGIEGSVAQERAKGELDEGRESADIHEKSPIAVTAQATLDEITKIKEIVSSDMATNSTIESWDEIKGLIQPIQAACNFINLEKLSTLVASLGGYITAVKGVDNYQVRAKEAAAIGDIISTTEYLLEDVVDGMTVDHLDISLAKEAATYLENIAENGQEAEEEADETSKGIVESNIDVKLDFTFDTDEEDEEILGIFIEEARGICVEADLYLARWKGALDNQEALRDFRRCFHTLKGSGRLAKVEFLSETAWAIEDMLNRVIDATILPNSALMQLTSHVTTCLPEWVESISSKRPSLTDMSDIIGAAEKIKNGDKADISFILETRQQSQQENGFDAQWYEIFSKETESHLLTIQNFISENKASEKIYVSEDLYRATHTLNGCSAMSQVSEIEELSGTVGEYLRELYDLNLPGDQDLLIILDEFLKTTRQQVVSLGAAFVPMPNHVDLHAKVQRLSAELHQSVIESVQEEVEVAAEELLSEDAASLNVIDGEIDIVEEASEISLSLEELESKEEEQTEPANAAPENVANIAENEIEEITVEAVKDVETESIKEYSTAIHLEVEEPKLKLGEDDFASTLSNDDDEMQVVFVGEGLELLDELTSNLQQWISDLDNFSYQESCLHILHTLKGSSQIVELGAFSDVTHAIETRLENIVKSDDDKNSALFQQIQLVIDALLVGLQSDDSAVREDAYFYSLLEQLDAIDTKKLNADGAAKDRKVKTETTQELPVTPITPAKENAIVLPFEVPDKTTKGKAKIAAKASVTDKTVKISDALLDRLISDVGEVNVLLGQITQKNKERQTQLSELDLTIDRLRKQLRKLEIETEAQVLFKLDKSEEESGFDPLELDRYSEIQHLSRSLLESISDLGDIKQNLLQTDEAIEELLRGQNLLTDVLMEDLLRTRMISFSKYSPRFERLIRQVSLDLGKPTNLVVEGGEVEIDSSILAILQTSIEHMLRNSLAHGIETTEKRVEHSKDKTAKITIHLTREGSEIHLSISDDGHGVDLGKVKKKANTLGWMDKDRSYSDEELLQFILRPGFTTATDVSKLSGRGIGMDVVSEDVHSIGGVLSIANDPGKGVSFHLVFPYTMAINLALMVKAKQELYAIPNNFIANIIRVEKTVVMDVMKQKIPILRYEGKGYPISDLASLIGHEKGDYLESSSKLFNVILVESRQQRYAILVDQIIGNKEVVVKPLGVHMSMIPWLSGSTVTNDGDIVMILDLPALALLGAPNATVIKEQLQIKKEEIEKPIVMVVDDSITFRKVATRLLERQGYEVVAVHDGIEAIEKLGSVTPDLFLLDVEMPRMDGFELSRHIRSTEEIADKPIVMVTSRTGQKHRDYSKKLGVNEHFGKPFDKNELLRSINRLVEGQDAGS
ncbi:MAG: hypothetical protein A6F71_03330 [Cycloclasticus sp. symbiont of Poecilosclerida sp. M]|nr:MAG: hypothetical protein A6F71_03330 [Cycloclasticus sp. symbiont of Poecilosclerida sp. M]